MFVSVCVRLDTKPSLRIDGTHKCKIGDGGSCCFTSTQNVVFSLRSSTMFRASPHHRLRIPPWNSSYPGCL
jgi:hypothetical protein